MLGSFLAALRRLSVIPAGESSPDLEGREGDQLVLFPVAGLALGLVPAAVLVAGGLLGLPGTLPEALAVAALAAVTGLRNLGDLGRVVEADLHRDAEAPGPPPAVGTRPPGAAGAAAATLALVTKYAALSGLRAALGGSIFGTALGILAAACAARWAAVVLAGYSQSAPARAGTEDDELISATGGREIRWGLAFAVAATVLLGLVGLGSLGLTRPLAALGACTLLGWWAAVHFRQRFAGACRECLGAVVEVAEVLALAAMCVLAPAGRGADAGRPAAPAAGPAQPGAVPARPGAAAETPARTGAGRP